MDTASAFFGTNAYETVLWERPVSCNLGQLESCGHSGQDINLALLQIDIFFTFSA